MRILKKTMLVIGCLILLQSVSWGATYYVDAVNGDDDNLGTSAQPWKTLAKSQSTITDGDVIYLMSGSYGSYEENKVSRSDWVTYKAAEGEDPHFDEIRLNSWDWDHIIYKSYLKFDGIIIDGSVDGTWVHTLEVSHLKFHNLEIIGDGYKYNSFDPNSDNTKGCFFPDRMILK